MVDDDENNQYLISVILRKNGFDVVIAGNGSAGVEAAKKQSVDLIIMDIRMPGVDGYKAAMEIRRLENYQSVPIIALTACVMAGDKKKALAAGYDGYMAKPINPETFVDEIRKYLEGTK